MTVLRGGGLAGGADEPYGPIVRAIGPALRACPTTAWPVCSGRRRSEVVRLLPDLEPRLRRSAIAGAERRRRPPRSDARPGRSRASWPARPARASGGRSCSSSRTSTAPTPRPGRWSRSWPGSPATSAWPSSARTSPTSCARDDPWTERPRRDRRRPAAARAARRSRRSIATSWRRSSRGSRASARRPACCSSSPSGRAGCRSSPRSCWPPGASCRARR